MALFPENQAYDDGLPGSEKVFNEVLDGATHAAVQASYIREALKVHGEKNHAAFKELVAAFEVRFTGLGPSVSCEYISRIPTVASAAPMLSRNASRTQQDILHLTRLQAALSVLTTSSRHDVIAKQMTLPQRLDLEQWILHQKTGVPIAHNFDDDVPSEQEELVGSDFTEDGHGMAKEHSLKVRTCGIDKEGGVFTASIYTRWLEIRGPSRHHLKDALRDHVMLVDLKQLIIQAAAYDLCGQNSLKAIGELVSSYGFDLSQVRARVMLPTGFWIGTRLATPHQNLLDALRTRRRLITHPAWIWNHAFLGRGKFCVMPGASHMTLSELWTSWREEFVSISTELGFAQSRVDARLCKLEEEDRHAHGSLEDRLLRRIDKLLKADMTRRAVVEIRRKKELCARKRSQQQERLQRCFVLRRRLREEKNQTMEQILAGSQMRSACTGVVA